MKGRVIVLQQNPDRAALVVDGRVEDLVLDASGAGPPLPGEIWATRVTRTNQGTAFVDLGGGHTGFLRDTRGLKGSPTLAVQISSVPEPGKAVPVDRRLLFKGRTLILTPDAPGVNVSRQIRDPEERERLTEALGDLPGDAGLIVRSAARGVDAEVLHAELSILGGEHDKLGDLTLGTRPIAQQAGAHRLALREWCTPLPDMIAVPDELEDRFSSLTDFFGDPELADRLTPGDGDPFDHFGVWNEIERLRTSRADLPSGGWVAVEATRAMVTIDVNTGEGFGQGDAMTANIEAVRELPRQLRLRGLGGQITIDFAPLKKQHRKKIEEELKRAFRRDTIDTTLAGWTPLGNFELQRKRERRPLSELLPG